MKQVRMEHVPNGSLLTYITSADALVNNYNVNDDHFFVEPYSLGPHCIVPLYKAPQKMIIIKNWERRWVQANPSGSATGYPINLSKAIGEIYEYDASGNTLRFNIFSNST